MKGSRSLRLRLTLGMLLVLTAALGICCALMLTASRRVMEASVISLTAREECTLLDRIPDQLGKMGPVTNGEGLTYVFRVLSSQTKEGSEFVLQKGDTEVYNNSGISPRAFLQERGTPLFQDNRNLTTGLCMADGKYLCVVGSEYPYYQDMYTVSVVKDVTEQMDQVNRLGRYCLLIGSAVTIASGVVIGLLLTRNLASLRVLQHSAEAIAGGDYSGRIQVPRRDEVGVVAESFNTMAEAVQSHIDAVEKTSQERNMLLHALSHEMRTPVTAISGYAYALTHMRMNGEQQDEALAFLERESRRLERLYTKLTELITVDDLQLSLRPIDPGMFRGQVAALLSPMAQKQGIHLRIQMDDQRFLGDFDLLMMLITNLYDNARKAGAKALDITLANGRLDVKDDGCGIPKEIQDKIMQPFYQGDTSRNQEGFGLGLALCRRIAVLHGSELYLESTPGQGAVFTTFLQLHDDSKTGKDVS